MNAHKPYTWLLISGLLIALALGYTLSSPLYAVGQGEGTPTHEPPPPRTLPPGIRSTPEPATSQNTPAPPPKESTAPTPVAPAPVATPVVLPVGGSPGNSVDLGLVIIVGGLCLLAVGLGQARRSRAE